MLTLAASLIERGCRVDLVLMRLKGRYKTTIPDGVRLYHQRLGRPDRALAAHCRERGIDARVLTSGPLGTPRAWYLLRRRFPEIEIRLSMPGRLTASPAMSGRRGPGFCCPRFRSRTTHPRSG